MTTPRSRSSRAPRAAARVATSRPASSKSAPFRRPLSAMSSHDCTVLALVLIERLSLTEAAATLELPVSQVRRDYEAALVRVRRSIAPVMARADLARAVTRPAAAWRRAS